MMRSKHLNEDIAGLEEKIKKGVATISDVVKGLCLCGKLLRDIKSNQATDLIHRGILKKSEPKKEKKQ